MTKEKIEQGFKDLVDAMRDGFGMCLREIKLLGDRMAAVEKKVESSKKATASNDLQLCTESPTKCGHEPESESVNEAKAGHQGEIGSLVNVPEDKAPEPSSEPSVLVLDKRVSTVSDVQHRKTRRQKRNDAAMVYVRGKVSEQGNFLPHSNLLLRKTSVPN
ncbi:hypothetical protein F2Q68_00038731 [Brassica cretica]|uniref:Uncharacterized protein n=1 Tax=Brassica cretica TaxID=69181 RepID=A0A8S9MGY7_BRACR|nr:hypothetical protein F2Q68_00038731 [Brassica cretica]